MVMDSVFYENSDYNNGFSLDDENTLPNFDQFSGHTTGYRFREEPFNLSFLDMPPPAPNNDPSIVIEDSPDEFTDFLNELLMEGNIENTTQGMFHDPLALQAVDKSFFEGLSEKYPNPNPPQPLPVQSVNLTVNVESPEEISYRSSGECSTHSSISGDESFETRSSLAQPHLYDSSPFRPIIKDTDSTINENMVPNIFTDHILQYQKGMEEASKFLPTIKPFVIDLDKYNLPSRDPPEVKVKVENIDASSSVSSDGYRARKHHHLEDDDYEEERSSKYKHSGVQEEEVQQLSEIFERVILCANLSTTDTFPDCHSVKAPHTYSFWNPSWRSVANDSFDIRNLLLNCAQSVALGDYKTATKQLKQIRQHASPSGNASQRLAYVFADGLEARLSGTGSQYYVSQKAVKISAAEKLKAFQAHVTSCPFKKNEVYFANRTIYEAALTSSTVHIVDFGIEYGFQWPIVIRHLANRPGGPPRIRITGIDYPQPGFRPAERVEETGRRLASYCQRFNVPFEYNAIAIQNWEMIRVEDMKVERNEFLAVNALTRFENLLDESVVADNSPRDSVLKMIREMRPDVFIHSVVNGSYSVPFFVTRFKEALFHYSALFDMTDATLDRGNVHRGNFERDFLGREAVNVIACEGRERVERPETCKQWQLRNMRAGFKPRQVDGELVSQLKSKVKGGYHKDFVFNEDGVWMLQGWKGRILCGISCWVSA